MSKAVNKEVIAVDIDEVLAAFAQGFADYSNQKWGTNLIVDDYDDHWGEVWGVEMEEAKKRAEHVHADASLIVQGLAHNSEAKEVLAKLSENFKLVIVTSRRKAIQKDTLEWIDKYFKGIFEEVHFAGIWDDQKRDLQLSLKATKAEVLAQIDADYLIDDQPKHCVAAARAGIKAVLFGDYRWNRNVELLENMVRAKNWQEVLEYFSEK